ncbi:MAG: hypothetical protein AB9903_27890 [Vulcanimicrobiota bacterium]
MFLASSVDLYEDPCPIVIMEKTGSVMKCVYEKRNPFLIAQYLEEIASEHDKIMFCAITEDSATSFPDIIDCLIRAHIIVKKYWLVDVLRIKNALRDLRTDLPFSAYCLAKLVQHEALDLCTFRDEINQIYRLRVELDNVLLSLMTFRAFPDDYRIVRPK